MIPASHVETMRVPGYRLGRRPHDPQRPTLRLGNLLTGTVPAHPVAVDHYSKVNAWGMLGNDNYGDCGPAMVEHDRMLVSKYLANITLPASLTDTLDLYTRSGNPHFPTDDNGVVIADMLAEVHANGIGPASARVKSVAYAQVNIADLDEIRAAVAIFGSVHLGVDLQTAQQAQTDRGGPWDYSLSQEWGGHAILAGYYTSDTTAGHPDLSVVTWGKPMGVTDAFWRRQTREAWVVIWPEHLGTAEFLAGVDQSALIADYAQVTNGKVLPVPVPPAPKPVPVPPVPPAPIPGPVPVPPALPSITAEESAANTALAALAHKYIGSTRAMPGNTAMQKELGFWLQAWGL